MKFRIIEEQHPIKTDGVINTKIFYVVQRRILGFYVPVAFFENIIPIIFFNLVWTFIVIGLSFIIFSSKWCLLVYPIAVYYTIRDLSTDKDWYFREQEKAKDYIKRKMDEKIKNSIKPVKLKPVKNIISDFELKDGIMSIEKKITQ